MSNKKSVKKSVEVIRKRDNTIEVAIRKNPAKTTFGKVAGIVILIGFIVLPVVALIFALIDMMSTI